jgi:hypothetical protein
LKLQQARRLTGEGGPEIVSQERGTAVPRGDGVLPLFGDLRIRWLHIFSGFQRGRRDWTVPPSGRCTSSKARSRQSPSLACSCTSVVPQLQNLPRLTVPVSFQSTENPLAMAQNACRCEFLHLNQVPAGNGVITQLSRETGFHPVETGETLN